jgi:hypothetical protein
MKLLNDYFNLQKQIYEYFSYVEDWVVIPLEDRRNYLWYCDNNENVFYAEKLEDFSNGGFYQDEIYTQRHLPKWVYRAKDYTMISVDTHTDGNKFLAVFNNKNELKEDPLEEW